MPEVLYGSPTVGGNIEVINNVTPSAVSVLTGSTATSGTSTLGTVPSNKKWYIIGMAMAISSSTANVQHVATILLNDVANWRVIMKGEPTYGGTSIADNVMFPYYALPILEETETVKLTLSDNILTDCSVWYVEVDA